MSYRDHKDHWEKQLEQLPPGHGGFSMGTINKVKERIRLERTKKSRIGWTAAIAASLALAVAALWAIDRDWLQPESAATALVADDEGGRVVVQYSDTINFMNTIGQPYSNLHPNVTLETTSPNDDQKDDLASYREWIERSQADVLQIPLAYIDDLAADGTILRLTDSIEQEGIKLADLHQPLLKLMLEAGGGDLYAMADGFDMDLLYYNKSLFERYNVPLPQPGATWDDIFRIAEQFNGLTAGGQPIYGLSFDWRPQPFNAIERVGRSEGLSLVDSNGAPRFDSEEWRTLWTRMTTGIRTGWINNEPEPPQEEGGYWTLDSITRADAFMTGRAAMAFQSYGFWDLIRYAANHGTFNDDWDALPVSASSSEPGVVDSYSNATIYAINAKSPNRKQALKLLAYILSKDNAERAYSTGKYALFANKPEGRKVDQDPADRFYDAELDVLTILEQAKRSALPGVKGILGAARSKGDSAVDDVIGRRSTVEEALRQLQEAAENIASAK